jgi:hypothetical protein
VLEDGLLVAHEPLPQVLQEVAVLADAVGRGDGSLGGLDDALLLGKRRKGLVEDPGGCPQMRAATIPKQGPHQTGAFPAEVEGAIAAQALVKEVLVDAGDNVSLLVGALVELLHESHGGGVIAMEEIGEPADDLDALQRRHPPQRAPRRLLQQLVQRLAVEGSLDDDDGSRQVQHTADEGQHLAHRRRPRLRRRRDAHQSTSSKEHTPSLTA